MDEVMNNTVAVCTAKLSNRSERLTGFNLVPSECGHDGQEGVLEDPAQATGSDSPGLKSQPGLLLPV